MSDSESHSDDIFDVDRIRRLVELMEEHNLREIDLRQSEQQIRLCRGAEVNYVQTSVPPPAVAANPAVSGPVTGDVSAADSPTESPPDDAHMVYITSPMVGTFYLRPNPNAEPFVRVGDMVEPETTVCIIEAMKVFNEIPAEVRGKIVAVLVDDEEPVDHGRRLFKVDTSAT